MTYPTPEALDKLVEFNCPFIIDATGRFVTDTSGIHAPLAEHDGPSDMLLDGVPYLESKEWEALTGYTGQYSYNGPVMHASEYLGGRMAEDVLATPGVYVAVIVEAYDEDDDEEFGEPAGWALLRRKHLA